MGPFFANGSAALVLLLSDLFERAALSVLSFPRSPFVRFRALFRRRSSACVDAFTPFDGLEKRRQRPKRAIRTSELLALPSKRNVLYRFSLRKRVFLFVVGIILAGLGVALTARASLGTSPISSLPYVLTFLTPLTFGTLSFLMNALFVVGQVAILGKKFQKRQLLQLPAVALFGFCIDFGYFLAQFFVPTTFALQLFQLIAGCVLLAVGIFFEIVADVLYLPGDGLIKAINSVFNISFGSLKIWFDFVLAASAFLVSTLWLRRLEGLGLGTLIAVFLVGWLVKRLAPTTRFVKRRLLVKIVS